jgi:hypothetical protein
VPSWAIFAGTKVNTSEAPLKSFPTNDLPVAEVRGAKVWVAAHFPLAWLD